MKHILLTLALIASTLLTACEKKVTKPPFDLSNTVTKQEAYISVPYEEDAGVKVISVKLNGIPMKMIYDTGCSGVSISLLELKMLLKNGAFNSSDLMGTTYACIADGSIVEKGLVNIRQIELGGEILSNISASVSENESAPLLIGNSVNDHFKSIMIDTETKTIKFYKE